MFKKLNNIGDCGIVCDFGEEVNREINTSVIKLFHHVKEEVLKAKFWIYQTERKQELKAPLSK